MNNEYVLLAPGPVNLHPKVREIMAQAMIHHRTPQFDAILARVLKNLRQVFQTSQPVMLLSCTGSGGMEALMVNTLSPGDNVIIINSGKFGERWVEMGQKFGLKVLEHKVAWGEAVNPKDIQNLLGQNPHAKAVLCQACETSSALSHPIKELAQIINQHPDCLFLVDGITALGAYDIPMDKWQIDGLVAGSQKAFMLPTGMSFVALSEKAWAKNKTATLPRFYFDLATEKKSNDKGETWFSSNVAIIRALDWVLEDILSKGLEKHFAEIKKRADFTRHFGQKLGLELYASAPSDSVSALKTPTSVDSQKVRADLESKKNITIMGGQDQAKGKILRIGHMGYIEKSHMIRLMLGLAEILDSYDASLHAQSKISVAEMENWWNQN